MCHTQILSVVKDLALASNFDTRDALRRLMTHAAQNSTKLPTRFIVKDVKTDYRPLDGGGFGDIYAGEYTMGYRTERVAIKCIRVKENMRDLVSIRPT